MKLSDYKTAIETMEKVLGDVDFNSITHSWDEKRIIFNNPNQEYYYVFYRNTHKIVKNMRNTWRTGKREVIYNGK